MDRYSLAHVPGPNLARDLKAIVARDRATTADLVAHIAEFDARRLYAPAGYPSMLAYCERELRLSEDAALKRIRAARLARRFPAIFALIADGRLHLTAVVLLGPELDDGNVDDLLAAATHRTKSEIERLVAERFPRPDVPSRLEPLAKPIEVVPEPVPFAGAELATSGPPTTNLPALAAAPMQPAPPMHPRIAPLSAERSALQCTVSRATEEKLRYVLALLGLAPGAWPEVIERMCDMVIPKLESRKFGATGHPRAGRPSASADPRHVPAVVKHAVWERDGGTCTFVSADGHRCETRTRLEFDHIRPVALGGEATADNLRLRCRGHNQHAAEQEFGAAFVDGRREERRRARSGRSAAARAEQERLRAAAAARAERERMRAADAIAARARARADQAAASALPWLREFGACAGPGSPAAG